MSEYEPNDSRVVHGNAKPEQGDKRFAEKPDQAKQSDDTRENLDDDAIRNPESAPSRKDANSQQQQSQRQSQASDAQFEASDLDRGEAQYQSEPLVQQQHQQSDWSEKNDQTNPGSPGFESGHADYGSARRKAGDEQAQQLERDADQPLGGDQRGYGQGSQARQDLVDDAEEGDLSDDDIDDAAPKQAQFDREEHDVND